MPRAGSGRPKWSMTTRQPAASRAGMIAGRRLACRCTSTCQPSVLTCASNSCQAGWSSAGRGRPIRLSRMPATPASASASRSAAAMSGDTTATPRSRPAAARSAATRWLLSVPRKLGCTSTPRARRARPARPGIASASRRSPACAGACRPAPVLGERRARECRWRGLASGSPAGWRWPGAGACFPYGGILGRKGIVFYC